MQYKGLYKDQKKTISLVVENDFEILSFELEGMKFVSSFFEDWSLVNPDLYTKEQLSAFSFMQSYNLLENGEKEKTLDLCDCCIEVIIPQTIIEKSTDEEFDVKLTGVVELGKVRPLPKGGLDKSLLNVKLEFRGDEYNVADCGDFENGMSQLLKQLGDKFYFKNCTCCLYGHCNAYGQPYLGGQQCFCRCKEVFLATIRKPVYDPKADLWHIVGKVDVQEIFCCENFAKCIKET